MLVVYECVCVGGGACCALHTLSASRHLCLLRTRWSAQALQKTLGIGRSGGGRTDGVVLLHLLSLLTARFELIGQTLEPSPCQQSAGNHAHADITNMWMLNVILVLVKTFSWFNILQTRIEINTPETLRTLQGLERLLKSSLEVKRSVSYDLTPSSATPSLPPRSRWRGEAAWCAAASRHTGF